jgi:lipopolysaccharide heptosyltransferase II
MRLRCIPFRRFILRSLSVFGLLQAYIAYCIGQFFFCLTGGQNNKQQINLKQVKRILVVRIDEIGDMVMTTPLLRELRRLTPNARITLVVKSSVYNLVEYCPYVDQVLTYTPGVSRYIRPVLLPWRVFWITYQHFWRRYYDLAIVPRWDVDNCYATFLAYFSGAPWRIGYSEHVNARKQRLNKGFDLLFTHVLHDRTLKHDVERNLDMVRYLGGMVEETHAELWVEADDAAFAENVFREHGVQPGDLIIGFGPSGGHSFLKQWPIMNFIELGKRLCSKFNAYILIIGGPGEEALGQLIINALNYAVINMIGKTTLRQMAALLQRCRLYISNDSGPMHVAAALGIPVLALFGSSCYHRFGPWGSEHVILSLELPCSPCSQGHSRDRCQRCIFPRHICMEDLSVEQVEKAAEEILREPLRVTEGQR